MSLWLLADGRGFEPPDPVTRANALAGRRIQPTLPPIHIKNPLITHTSTYWACDQSSVGY